MFNTVVISAVYAVGLYVDPKAAKKLLSSKQADISAVQGIPEQAVFDGAHTHWLHIFSLSTTLYRCPRLVRIFVTSIGTRSVSCPNSLKQTYNPSGQRRIALKRSNSVGHNC
jgi:hypothetical protein